MIARGFPVFLVSLWFGLASCNAGPVAEDDRVPIDLRRTTFTVRDMDASLAFYRDALGLKVIYDNVIRDPRDAKTDEEATQSRRLVFLRANDDYIGILGLLHYTVPKQEPPESQPAPFTMGSVALIFNVKNVDETFARVKEVPGIQVYDEPADVTYPSYDGKSTIPVRTSTILDPDGHAIEINQLLIDDLR